MEIEETKICLNEGLSLLLLVKGFIKWTLFKIGGHFHFFLSCTSFLAVTYFVVLSE